MINGIDNRGLIENRGQPRTTDGWPPLFGSSISPRLSMHLVRAFGPLKSDAW
jgi:hypothetical protein